MKINILIVFLIVVFSVSADIIYFKNGDIEEGYVKINEGRVRVLSRDELNEYEMSTNQIKSVEYGIWIEDKGKVTKEIAKVSSGNVTIIEPPFWDFSKFGNKGFSLKSVLNNIGTVRNISIILLVLGVFVCIGVSFVGNVIILIDAFKKNILWGIFGLIFFPIVLLIYLLTNYKGNRGRMFFWVYLLPLLWGFATIILISRI